MKATHTTVQRFSAFIAVFNNLLLITLIKFKSHRKVGSYKYLMIYISVFETIYAILDALLVPEIYSRDSAFLVVIQTDQSLLPPSFFLLADVLFCVFFGISMAMFAVHFVYRYLSAIQHKYVKNHNTRLILGLLTFPIIFGLGWGWLTFYIGLPTPEANQFLKENFLDKHNVSLEEVNYVGPHFWPKGADGKLHISWKSSIGILIMSIAIGFSFSFVFFFGYKCYQQTKTLMQQTSQSFSSLQSQLFYALVVQTLIPVLLMHIPATIGFAACFFNVSFELIGQVPSVTICLYPTLDPLPNFFIIKTYREAISGFGRSLMRIVCGHKSSKVEDVVVELSSLASRRPTTTPLN